MTNGNWERALQVLRPLSAGIEDALEDGNAGAAASLAYGAALDVVELVCPEWREVDPERVGVHGVYVELVPVDLRAQDDGTLVEHDDFVRVTYQYWDVAPDEVQELAGQLFCELGKAGEEDERMTGGIG